MMSSRQALHLQNKSAPKFPLFPSESTHGPLLKIMLMAAW
jgi:hypothetical protein